MINKTLSSYTLTPSISPAAAGTNAAVRLVETQTTPLQTMPITVETLQATSVQPITLEMLQVISVQNAISVKQTWLVFAAAVFLVSVPVFIEAPLVRSLPLLSLAMTIGLIWLSFRLMSDKKSHLWGDILVGFSLSWLAGSIYWGWLRTEPLLHLPVEAIGVPFALVCLQRGWAKVGSFFYLGSLIGTIITDVYFYIVDLIPYWRQIMQVEPSSVSPILHSALVQVQSPWGLSWALVLATMLLTVGILPLQRRQYHWWAFSGAVLSTILVDSLFWLAAALA